MSKTKKLIIGLCIISILLSATALMLAYCLNQEEAVDVFEENAGHVVIIDAGHGGEDGGAVGIDGTLEKNLNLQVAEKLKNMLNSNGITVVLTRENDSLLSLSNSKTKKKMQDLKARVDLSKKYDDCIFVSIHMNKYSSEEYSGLQVFYSDNNKSSELLARTVQNNIKTYVQNENNREIKKVNSNIYLLEKLQVPNVLIECGFLSNNEECILLKTEEYQQKIAGVICISIVEFLNTL